MAVSRPGSHSAGATLLIPHERGAAAGGDARSGAIEGCADGAAWYLGSSVLRPRALLTDAAPRIIAFARQQARFVRVTIESSGDAGPRASIRTLSVLDSSSPTVDLALRKRATASSHVSVRSAEDPDGAGSAVDGNPCTRWTPAAGDSRPWIQLDLGGLASFDHLCLVSDILHLRSIAVFVSVSADGETWTEPATAEDPFTALRIDLAAAAPPCPSACEPVHVHVDPRTWQALAVNHTAQRITGARLTARVYEPFGRQLSHIEQQDLVIEPLSVAPGFVVARPAYLPPTHLLSLQLHDAAGTLLSELHTGDRARN